MTQSDHPQTPEEQLAEFYNTELGQAYATNRNGDVFARELQNELWQANPTPRYVEHSSVTQPADRQPQEAAHAALSEAELATVNQAYLERLAAGDPEGRQASEDAVNDFTRTRIREDGFFRRVMPPVDIAQPVVYTEDPKPERMPRERIPPHGAGLDLVWSQ